MRVMKSVAMRLAIVLCAMAFSLAQSNAIEIKTVKTKLGITALLVEDYTLPLISMAYSFKGGTSQDMPEKAGGVRLLSSLIDEGAGEYDSVAFRSRLEELGIEFSFSSSRDYLNGSIRSIRSDRHVAFEMLKLALNEPRFDDDAVERMRDAIRTGIKRSRTNPSSVASKTLRETLFADHAYALTASGDEETIDAITRQDVVDLHRKLFARNNLTIGVVGAISEEELASALDDIFGGLPERGEAVEIADINPILEEAVSVDMPIPNATISLVYKGVRREDPDFFAAYLLSNVIGGGIFSSRLYEELREKRGLVYGVYSNIATPKHSAYFAIQTTTRADNRDKVILLIRDEIEKVAKDGVSQEELDDAKKYVLGAYAINNLDTSGKIAGVLVAMQNQNLGVTYIEDRVRFIESVTLEQVNRIAGDLLSVEPAQIVVGPATP